MCRNFTDVSILARNLSESHILSYAIYSRMVFSLKMSVLCHRKPYFTGIFHTNGWCPEFPENWMATLIAIFIFCNKWL